MALLDESRPRTRADRWPTASDDALIRGAGLGADGAFAEIFARYHAPIVRYCRGILLDDDLAQDAAQTAFAGAFRALRGGRSTPHVLGPWLYRIAQREAFDAARRRRADLAARELPGPDGEDVLLSIAAPSDDGVRDRLRELVGDLAGLPLRQRSALLLRELSGLGYADIAVALETTPTAARQSVLEARHALAEAGEGRRESCADVRALIDAGDRRRLRGRRVGAHLADCAGCRLFATRIEDRRRDLALLFPLPAALATGGGALAAFTGGGAAAGGAAVGGGWSLGLGGLGASGAAKCAIACTAAIVGVGAIGERVVHPSKQAPIEVIAQAPQPAGGSASPSPTAVPTPAAKPTSTRKKPVASAARTVRAVQSGALASHGRTGSARVPAARGLGETGSGSGTHAEPPADPPATTTPTTETPAPATPAPAAETKPTTTAQAPAGTASGTTNRQQQLAAELQRRTQEAIDLATAAAQQTAKQAVQQSATLAQQMMTSAQQLTTGALTSVQTMLQQLLQPGSTP